MSHTEDALGDRLLARARRAIEHELRLASAPCADEDMSERGATFVTLTEHGQLRGCIGSLKPTRSLADDVAINACNAAFRDPRFPPVSAAEWPDIRIEVSLIGASTFLEATSESDVIARLRPGEDGVILFNGCRGQATFLPQVWEQIPAPGDFLAALKQKAGLPPDFWSSSIMIATYPVRKWKESERSAARPQA
ncbi:AmmeMemoRadiSam system protein A [Nitrogeniibacter aestuarii]|uniref:AmmeMemoRadiSam system protein A n=1 Tax=Nitrogeniibacter aestuarii TaxID=2815343 RepID=UPI001E6471E7|nr:AmmeMemoRadiSam system protein A [Nitrogeniibacter aestuarii]